MRKKFLVCILLPCCILIAACGHTADTKNDLLSENITSDTETDTQTSDYEKYNNYGSTEEQMDEAITETSETASSSEENDLPEQSLQKYSDDWDESQIWKNSKNGTPITTTAPFTRSMSDTWKM